MHSVIYGYVVLLVVSRWSTDCLKVPGINKQQQ